MKTFNQFTNESIRDKMIPKSEKDIDNAMSELIKYCNYKPEYKDNIIRASLIETSKNANSEYDYSDLFFLRLYIKNNFNIDNITEYSDMGRFSRIMKDMLPKLMKQYGIGKTNESIRDKMIPKSKEEIDRIIGQLTPTEKFIKGYKENYKWLMELAMKEGVTEEEIWELLIKFKTFNTDKLHFGCMIGSPKIVQKAIDIIPNLTTRLKEVYYHALDLAIHNNNVECVDLLIKINRKYYNLIDIKNKAQKMDKNDIIKLVDGYLKTNN